MTVSEVVAAAAAKKIEFEDPHAGMQEAEVTRVRTLRGAWRWALIVATAATILLCINQQFSLRFFLDYTQLNTEYFYLLIALMLPFTFLIFPGTETAPTVEKFAFGGLPSVPSLGAGPLGGVDAPVFT